MANTRDIMQIKQNLIKENPDCWVYTFKSRPVREKFLNPIRTLSQADAAIKEAWGFKTDSSDIELLNNTIKELTSTATEIIGYAYDKASHKVKFNINEFTMIRPYEKQKLLKPMSDIIIPDGKFDVLYEVAITIDEFDLAIKDSEYGNEWVNKILEYAKSLEQKQKIIVEGILVPKFKARELAKYKILRKMVGKIKESKINKEKPAKQ